MCETDRNSQLVRMHTMQDADYTLLRRARREVGGERERVMHLTLLYERLHAWGDMDRVESCGFSRRQVEAAVRARCKLLYMSDTAVNSPPRSLLVSSMYLAWVGFAVGRICRVRSLFFGHAYTSPHYCLVGRHGSSESLSSVM